MFEIELRAWIPEIKKMLPVTTISWDYRTVPTKDSNVLSQAQLNAKAIDLDERIYTVRFDFKTNRMPIFQHIGLKDRKGVKIFTGDILEFEVTPLIGYDSETGKKEWGQPYKVRKVVTYIAPSFQLTSGDTTDWIVPAEMEVVGNIHQNPELVK